MELEGVLQIVLALDHVVILILHLVLLLLLLVIMIAIVRFFGVSMRKFQLLPQHQQQPQQQQGWKMTIALGPMLKVQSSQEETYSPDLSFSFPIPLLTHLCRFFQH